MIYQNILEYIRIYQNISEHIRNIEICQNKSIDILKNQNISGYIRIFLNISLEYIRIGQNIEYIRNT